MDQTTVFLDVGGTILDSPIIFDTAARELASGQPDDNLSALVGEIMLSNFPREEEPYCFLTIEEVLAKTLRSLARDYGYPDTSNRAHELYLETYYHRASYFPETLEVLDSLLSAGVKMVMASDADAEIMGMEIAKFNLAKYFTDICLSGICKAYKPTRGFTRHLEKHIPQDKAKCYFVGDSRVDIESGTRLGIKSVHIDRKKAGNIFNADYCLQDLRGLLEILKRS